MSTKFFCDQANNNLYMHLNWNDYKKEYLWLMNIGEISEGNKQICLID